MKAQIKQLETKIDLAVKDRRLKQQDVRNLIDEYFNILINLLNEINGYEENSGMHNYEKCPLNFDDRIHYIEGRKYHYMGYEQLKTMMKEVLKLKAIYDLKNK
ncbi:YpoC family protein [Macrococcus armenti]|uniref:YpoC family protein n=1 Tax=Macrococcus armenti TaxID=2875764 RepID=UPI001CCED3E9|nr:hypothetical protein [Macrococcus armenti]UBH12188.1 hypothetical protein LAU43_06265 [Macrococcus armenti]